MVLKESGLDEGANFYTSVVQELRKTVEEASRIADAREGERQAAKRNAQAGGSQRHAAAGPYAATPGGRAQVHAATAFMAPAPAASPYPQQYGGAQQSPYPAPQPVQQQPYNPYNPQQLAQAQPYRPAQPVQPQASSATPKIMCCKCHKIFQVPPGAKIVGCPFCGTHNRVP